MKKNILIVVLALSACAIQAQTLRPPSVPLVTHDPYFSIWSPADRLYDRETVHWTGKNHSLNSIIRIDGNAYRLMGSQPSFLEPLMQQNLRVDPTRTRYTFTNRQVSVELTFTTPALPQDLDLLSRPVTYLTWKITPVDGAPHQVQLYFGCGGEIAVNTPGQEVVWNTPAVEGLQVLRMGSREQKVLEKKGDDLRIDWGYLYLAAPGGQRTQMRTGDRTELMKAFAVTGNTEGTKEIPQPARIQDSHISMGISWDLQEVKPEGRSVTAMLAYDDLYSIRYFGSDLKAWWKRNGQTMEQLLPLAWAEYEKRSRECETFDTELRKDLVNTGGARYAEMSSLVYRQCLAAHKLVSDAAGKPLLFSKENFSNGCIATVDVIYPASPFFFLFSTALTKAMLQPNLDYAASPNWPFPFAPHDMGTYPHATGQVYGGGEKTEENQMPVEETGNMIIMTAVLAKMEGNADFAESHWPVLEKWCDYLLSKGFDPENQLCTDDFAGHLAHNINLSAKAIEAIGSYALLCEMTGRKDKAREIRNKAESMAAEWVKQAVEGDHTRLAFDRSGTWSQKYNLVWDRLLGLHLFPEALIQQEIHFYLTKQAAFGLPLDSRERYTKNDWITWTASMADQKELFMQLFDPVWQYAHSTPHRVPLSDWYIADNAYMVGFQARSVVGGFFIKMLTDQAVWNKWLSRGTRINGPWAPIIR
jgi:hypothetical protein